jgi:hypothetical protein
MHAPDVGSVLWKQTLNFSFLPTSLADGIVFSGTLGRLLPPSLNAYDPRSGALLASFKMPGSDKIRGHAGWQHGVRRLWKHER